MANRQRKTIYSDIPISLIAHPITGDVAMLENENAVKQSVKNIVLTNFYERPYSPYFGGDVISQLFENATPLTEFTVRKNIQTALRNYETRANVHDIIVKSNPDENGLAATIIFSVKGSREPITLNVLLERIR